MSNAPYLLPKARFGYKMGDGELIDHMTSDGLTSTFTHADHGRGEHVVSAEIALLPCGSGRVGAALTPARRGGIDAGSWPTRSCR